LRQDQDAHAAEAVEPLSSALAFDAELAACVEDFRQLAEAVLPKAAADYIAHGSTDQLTLRDNVAAFGRIRLWPPLLHGVGEVDTTMTLLGSQIKMPILIAPTAAQNAWHPDGILATARAAKAAGTILGVSSSGGHTAEEIAAVSDGPKWFQLYVPTDRDVGKRLVPRVEKAGYVAIIVTVDLGERKDADLRNRFAIPIEMLKSHLIGYGFEIPNRMTEDEVTAFNLAAWDTGFGWEIFDWLRSITKLPLLIKGVLRAEDAQRAVDLSLAGVVVSNHGGRRLDGVPASIDCLENIVKAVEGRAAVLLDSGVRRGTDVFKALALGANAVLIGRPYVWALAANGEAGVRHVMQLLHEELVSAMQACGCAKVTDITSVSLAR
jgi:isopentenyl diphosphate isomerase/L-lactate dehydrogenase-like FMN-dependent dehydrogenase